ncbi:hypothetical protein G9464_02290 [Halostella sp. JP-L12]|uniref:hypothetical protein n=1 Tax=Halostella TaxID=1843185 RepID=UPI000EF7D439|nr:MULTISPECIES: hypothetical protein [Halostella]NHN46431.1 hypothetical protein [Halostella sp. JP-L12]
MNRNDSPQHHVNKNESTTTDDEELQLQLELLREENERLRRSYALARQSSYRRTALGLAGIGVTATAGAALFPPVREVLLALGGTGLFAAVLVYYLTPEQFIAAGVGSSVYGAMAETEAAIVDDLGLARRQVYVPTDAPDPEAWLFVPQHEEYQLPDTDALASPFVLETEESSRGVSFRPTGEPLVREFNETGTDIVEDDPAAVVERFAEAVAEQFELAESVTVDVSAEEGRATVAVTGSTFGAVDLFDHPIQSVLAVGLSRELAVPVTTETTATPDDRADYLVTLRWDEAT